MLVCVLVVKLLWCDWANTERWRWERILYLGPLVGWWLLVQQAHQGTSAWSCQMGEMCCQAELCGLCRLWDWGPASFTSSRLRVYLSLLYKYYPFLCVSWCEKKKFLAGLVLGSYARLQGARFTGMDGSCFPQRAISWQCFVLVTVMGTSM